MKTLIFTLFVMVTLVMTPARAESMNEMKRDAQRDFDKADAELNKVYQKSLDGLRPTGAGALKEAEHAWIIFRDKTAEAYGTQEEGGSLEGLMCIRCAEAITQNRIKE